MAAEYGLPGLAALDTPYGLAPDSGIANAVAPTYFNISTPGVLSPMRPREPQAPPPGMGVLQPQFLLQQNTQSRGAGIGSNIPMVGRDIPIEEFIRIHKQRESGNNYQALNRQKPGNTASGAYQYTDATWNNYGGYAKALQAPKEVQDRRYQEDLMRRVAKYNGDPFRAMAEHYLPALANDPRQWGKRYQFKGGNSVDPVSKYLRQMLKGTKLEQPLEEYLGMYGIQ